MDTPPPSSPNDPPPRDPFDEPEGSESFALPSEEERNWAMGAHLASLVFLIGGAGYLLNIVGPLIVWVMKKDTMPFVDYHGKESMNFQILVTIIQAVLFVLFITTFWLCIGYIFLLPMAVVYFGQIILSIIAGIKARDGEMYRYPWNYQFLK